MIDTLKYTKQLEGASFSPKQAQATVEVLADVLDKELASKNEMTEMDRKLSSLEMKLSHRIEKAEFRLTIKLGTMLAVSIALITAILKVL